MQATKQRTLAPWTGFTLQEWREGYAEGRLCLRDVAQAYLSLDVADNAWISVASEACMMEQVQRIERLVMAAGGDRSQLPLYGIPFAVKDNIDAAGWLTTAACSEYAYLAEEHATAVKLLLQAGALLVGKTNLDQFATGLVGVRSPYGAVVNPFNEEYISGGSSSGSASVVARGLVPFSLGTDTAGSGRVPAAFQNIVGLKPTRGWFSTKGVVPACRTLDCVSVFALTVEDAHEIAAILGRHDEEDPYSRTIVQKGAAVVNVDAPRVGIPQHVEFFGDIQAEHAFQQAVTHWQQLGAVLVPMDFSPFAQLAELLYQGPWVAERYVTIETLVKNQAASIHPVVCGIIAGASRYSAVDGFKAEYQRAALAAEIRQALEAVDALMVPTTPSIYRISEVEDDPIRLNSRLGTYTNFTNLADLAALALPGPFRRDGLPAGITLLANAASDERLGRLGQRWQESLRLNLGATTRPYHRREHTFPTEKHQVRLAVVGAHLRGMPLNGQLTARGASFIAAKKTAKQYRFFALPGTVPPKPALMRVEPDVGEQIDVEIWSMPLENYGSFVAEVPAPLGIGSVRLADGSEVDGFICEPYAFDGATEITSFGGWKAYLKSLK